MSIIELPIQFLRDHSTFTEHFISFIMLMIPVSIVYNAIARCILFAYRNENLCTQAFRNKANAVHILSTVTLVYCGSQFHNLTLSPTWIAILFLWTAIMILCTVTVNNDLMVLTYKYFKSLKTKEQ